MRHIYSLADANLSQPSVVTIGAYDGVHRGHQHLIRQLVAHAHATGCVPVVLTFHPLPRMVLGGFEPGFYLTLPDDRAALLGELGVELVVTHPFNDRVRHIRAAEFVDSLLEHLHMRALWIGEDFAMGYKREGNAGYLRQQGRQKGFEVRVVDLMDAGDEKVSSSLVRQALAAGEIAEVIRLLGRPHFITGEVVEGAKRGRTIGFPTANLAVSPELAVPGRGVYAGRVSVEGDDHPAVINVGVRPTFDGANALTIEAHLLDFSGDLYGRRVRVHFVARLRDERRFESADALVAQIRRDVEQGRRILATSTQEDAHT